MRKLLFLTALLSAQTYAAEFHPQAEKVEMFFSDKSQPDEGYQKVHAGVTMVWRHKDGDDGNPRPIRLEEGKTYVIEEKTLVSSTMNWEPARNFMEGEDGAISWQTVFPGLAIGRSDLSETAKQDLKEVLQAPQERPNVKTVWRRLTVTGTTTERDNYMLHLFTREESYSYFPSLTAYLKAWNQGLLLDVNPIWNNLEYHTGHSELELRDSLKRKWPPIEADIYKNYPKFALIKVCIKEVALETCDLLNRLRTEIEVDQIPLPAE